VKRYYYTDKYAAVYMQEAFGMRFLGRTRKPTKYIDALQNMRFDEHQSVWRGVDTNHQSIDGKLYIHPDSEKLLELKNGDIVFFKGDDMVGDQIYFLGDYEENNWIYEQAISAPFDFDETPKIIQRNDKSFFWPEKEEASK